MHHRRSQSDTKSTSSLTSSPSTMPSSNNSSTTGRVSIYSMRERVILNKMTRMMGTLAPDTETEVTSRLHQEIPAIRLDGHLTYCLYLTLQNFIHLNVIYVLFYHGIFWFDRSKSHYESVYSTHLLDHTPDEQTHFLRLTMDFSPSRHSTIETHLINRSLYFSLIGIGSIELIIAFIWTLRKKLPYLIPRHEKLQIYFSKFLLGMIFSIYIGFFLWLLFQTIFTHNLPLIVFPTMIVYLFVLTLLDKPHLFQRPIDNQSSSSSIKSTYKSYRNSTSSSSTTSSLVANNRNRVSHRSTASTQPRKRNPIVNSPPIIPWSRWSSILEEKLDIHECSSIYSQARQEADDFWPKFVRRMLLIFYRTLSSFILFDILPIYIINPPNHIIEKQSMKFLLFIIILSTFLTHSTFLFPVKFHTTLHRIAIHLGQWRRQSNLRTESINLWSPECNSYTRGSVVKFSSKNEYYIAIQHMNNAAHPRCLSHSILYRLFSEATYLPTIQFILCLLLIICHIIWTIHGEHWEQILVSCLIIFYSSYSILKIVRDRVILDLVDEYDVVQTNTTKKIT